MNNTLFDTPPAPSRLTADLPPLQGSERQVRWATDIREKAIREGHTHLGELRRLQERHAAARQVEQAGRAYEAAKKAAEGLARLERIVDSRFWITHRENTITELLSGAEARPGDEWAKGRRQDD